MYDEITNEELQAEAAGHLRQLFPGTAVDDQKLAAACVVSRAVVTAIDALHDESFPSKLEEHGRVAAVVAAVTANTDTLSMVRALDGLVATLDDTNPAPEDIGLYVEAYRRALMGEVQ